MKTCLATLIIVLGVTFGVPLAIAEQIEENWQPYVIYKPDPVIPAVALRKGWGGTMRLLLTINPKNGVVDEVKVLRHSGHRTLDAEVVMTMFKWRFRPGTVTKIGITYQVGVAGRARSLHGGEHLRDILNN
jgi:TonB family protein